MLKRLYSPSISKCSQFLSPLPSSRSSGSRHPFVPPHLTLFPVCPFSPLRHNTKEAQMIKEEEEEETVSPVNLSSLPPLLLFSFSPFLSLLGGAFPLQSPHQDPRDSVILWCVLLYNTANQLTRLSFSWTNAKFFPLGGLVRSPTLLG